MLCLIGAFIATVISSSSALPAGNYSIEARVDGTVNTDVSSITNPKAALLKQSQRALSGLLPMRPFGREYALLEQETVDSRKKSIYTSAQNFVSSLIRPSPILDTIAEVDKYGNNGDYFRPIGNALVEGYEGFSNFINIVVDLPFETMKKITRTASSYLSGVGAKLVGL